MTAKNNRVHEVGIGAVAPSPPLLDLLAACGLPTADLAEAQKLRLYGAWLRDELVGSVGLEPYGEIGLLRSLAIAPRQRGSRLGKMLLAHAEREAARLGVRELWLLTNGADRYFRRSGYAIEDRNGAPPAIRGTAQFKGLCPASAVMLRKTLPA
jgi:amino-acid N-acetyltransferase